MILKIVYGIDVGADDATLAIVEKGLEGTREVVIAGGFLVDHFPALRHAPAWVPFQRLFARWRAEIALMRSAPFDAFRALRVRAPLGSLVGRTVADDYGNDRTLGRSGSASLGI